MLTREAVWWFFAIALLVWLLKAEKLPLRSIGLRPPLGKTIGFGLLGAVALLAVFVVHYALIIPKFHLDPSGAASERNLILAKPYWFRVEVVLRAAVVEEIIFRGYMIEKVRQVTGSTALAFVVSIATFTLAHFSRWGLVHLIPVFGSALVLALPLRVEARSGRKHDRAFHHGRHRIPLVVSIILPSHLPSSFRPGNRAKQQFASALELSSSHGMTTRMPRRARLLPLAVPFQHYLLARGSRW